MPRPWPHPWPVTTTSVDTGAASWAPAGDGAIDSSNRAPAAAASAFRTAQDLTDRQDADPGRPPRSIRPSGGGADAAKPPRAGRRTCERSAMDGTERAMRSEFVRLALAVHGALQLVHVVDDRSGLPVRELLDQALGDPA